MLRALIFDWGDTLMRDLGNPGPMARWPRVEAVPGAAEALPLLHGRYRLALATNAADSDATLVRQALHRVGLERYLDPILTSRELGARKPSPDFFQAVLHALDCTPEQAALIGDDYRGDIVGAKAAGLRAIWLHPAVSPCPPPPPRHDAEIDTLARLPQLLDQPFPPDLDECRALLAEQGITPNIVRHATVVATIAYHLACRLRERGLAVDPLLAHRGGLLHDLDKLSVRDTDLRHGQLGAQVLRERGYPALAQIVARHLMTTSAGPPQTWEEKLVHYADKLVEEDQIVPLEERLASLQRRYPGFAASLRQCRPQIEALEADICGQLGTTPPALLAWLTTHMSS